MPLESQHNFLRLKLRKRPAKGAEELPKGYSPYSSATYYNLGNAQAIQKQLDTLDPTNKTKEIIFKVDKYKSVNTVYQQIYQGWRYLIEKCDTEGKYATLRVQMSLRKERDRVRLYWNSRSCPTINGVAIELAGIDVELVDNPDAQSTAFNWKESLMAWATNAADGTIEERKIVLSAEELEWARGYLLPFPDLVILRLDGAGYKLTKNARLAQAIREERGES